MASRSLTLLRSKAWIGGRWTTAANDATFPVFDPCNGQKISEVVDSGAEETDLAIREAFRSKNAWGNSLATERAKILRNFYDLLLSNQEELASLVSLEAGKPLVESRAEISYGASFVEWFAEEAKRVYGDVLPPVVKGRRLIVIKQPLGVAALITPWNFPVAMILRKAAAALAAGCTCVIKPSEETPLSALALAELSQQASFPPGVFNVVPTSRNNTSAVGDRLCYNDLVNKLSFTGSTRVGKMLMSKCAGTVKKISLELGGNAPLIVFDSADLELAVKGTMAAKFRNAGQACISPNRILVQAGIHDAFVSALSEAVSRLKVGHAFHEGVTLGALINRQAIDKIKHLVDDAVSKGANVRVGGACDETLGELFYQPTVLMDTTTKMKLTQEEIFGPVAAIIKFDNEEEAIAIANNTPYGLASYIFTTDMGQIWRVGEALECGIVGVNEGAVTGSVAPFGGIKQSGFGREGSKYGIQDYLYLKYICIGGIN